jgi:alkaline phosphatase D
LFALAVVPPSSAAEETRQSTGVKVGEVTETTAIVWMRLTAKSSRNDRGVANKGSPQPLPEGYKVEEFEGACPGAAGAVQLRYDTDEGLGNARETESVTVGPETDFSHQFHLNNLKPNTTYYYEARTSSADGKAKHGSLRGRFRTAPPRDQPAKATFTVVTGMAYKDIDDHPRGFHIYRSMLELKPDFLVPTGDTVYYDSEHPRAVTPELARHHWARMYGYPNQIQFHLHVPAFWEKDDHDTLSNDCWPTMNARLMRPLTFEQGLKLFREQVPMGEKTYRTVRWGKDLQVWLVEGRDFRSPNNMKDGPDKTIWGAEQKKWFKDTVLASDATWKVLVSPTPIVGPDRGNKADNHANTAFTHEGDEVRSWIQKNVPDNFFVACGDRHWQYHSIHPETRVHEFSCGPASDQHAGGSPGLEKDYHQFHRVKGGFLSVNVGRSEGKSAITFRLHDVMGKVEYEYRREKVVE